MMAEFKSPYNFWAEAINTSCHAANYLYLRKILNKTPYEIITGKKPNIKYFRVFGCKCFILKKVLVCLNSSRKQMRAYLLVMRQTITHIVSTTSPPGLLKNLI